MGLNDESFQLMALKMSLDQCQIEYKEAINGLEALQQVQKKNSKSLEFDFILLDLNMPIMNGFEACKQIKQFYDQEKQLFKVNQNRDVDNVPLMVACSGFIDDDTQNRCQEVGFDVIIEAPLSAEKIRNQILPLVEEKRSQMRKGSVCEVPSIDDVE